MIVVHFRTHDDRPRAAVAPRNAKLAPHERPAADTLPFDMRANSCGILAVHESLELGGIAYLPRRTTENTIELRGGIKGVSYDVPRPAADAPEPLRFMQVMRTGAHRNVGVEG